MTRELTVDTPVGSFAVLDCGGTGHDILLLHHLGANAMIWSQHLAAFSGLGRVYAADLRGHGHTAAEVDGPLDNPGDMTAVATALGLRRPLLVLSYDDGLVGAAERYAELDPIGMLVLGDVWLHRGERARAWFMEQTGPDVIDRWAERFNLFATGPEEDLPAYVDATVASTLSDRLLVDATEEGWRPYLERAMRVEHGRFERRPQRLAFEACWAAVERGPWGFDLYDSLDFPMAFILSRREVPDHEVAEADGYCATRRNRRICVLDGGPATMWIETAELARWLRLFLDRWGRQAA